MKHAGVTFSAKKLYIRIDEVSIVGHTCNYAGCIPDDAWVSKILNWPPCENITEVHGFLGTCGVMWIFIECFSEVTHLWFC
jgi:hypothetical protein